MRSEDIYQWFVDNVDNDEFPNINEKKLMVVKKLLNINYSADNFQSKVQHIQDIAAQAEAVSKSVKRAEKYRNISSGFQWALLFLLFGALNYFGVLPLGG